MSAPFACPTATAGTGIAMIRDANLRHQKPQNARQAMP